MTTYTLEGAHSDWRDNDDWTGIVYTGFSASATFTVTAMDDGGFSYTLRAPEKDGDVWADVDLSETYFIGLDSTALYPSSLSSVRDANVNISEITWKSGGVTHSTTLLEFSVEWGDDATGHMEGSDYFFVIDGDALPEFSSLSEFKAFANTDRYILAQDEVTGDFAEGEYILWSDLLGIEVASEDDDIYGTKGKDVLDGGAGDDYFVSSKGDDTYKGGAGYDQVSFKDDPSGVTANLAEGTATDGWGDTDTLMSIEMLRGSAHDDTLIGNGGNNVLRGLAGDDLLNGGKGAHDEVRYDRDAHYGGSDGVTVNLQKGTATDGFGDTDTLKGIEDARGSESKDKITGSKAKNALEGLGGNDVIKGLGGKDTLLGDGGRDKLLGGGGADTLEGGSGNDKLIGGGGDDSLSGDGGNDKFIFKGKFGNDVIYDFETAGTKEKIDLRKVGAIESFDDLSASHLSEVDGSAVIDDGSGNTITLDGIAMADLSANDFLF